VVDVAVEGRSVSKHFGQGDAVVKALDNVSVQINKGEFFTLLGPSGCGKTTLLRMIAGFESPTSGQILLDGQDITRLPPNRRPVNTVFQSYALFPHLTVAQNIGFGLQMQGKPTSEVAARTAKMLALVKLEAMAGRKTSQLSGGQQQRVALARALAPQPKVLLLDEPLSALDAQTRDLLVEEFLAAWRRERTTAVHVTHNLAEALRLADRVAVLSRRPGRIREILAVDVPREERTRPDRAARLAELTAHLWSLLRGEALAADRELAVGGPGARAR